jgi:integrase
MGYFRGLKEENGIWQYRFVLNGVLYRGSTKCSDDKEAIKWLNHYKSKISLGDIGVRNPPTLEKLLDEWKQTAALTNDPQQISSMDSAIRTHCKQLLKVKVDKLTTQLVKRVLIRYTNSRGKGPGRKSHSSGGANALLLRLNTLMGFAIDCNYIIKKPYKITREQPQARPRTIVRAPKIKDFLVALDANTRSSHVRLAIALQAGLGLRESEALGARWEWINWEANFIQIVRYYRGKLRTKNKQVRELPMPTWLRTRLLAHWEASGKPKVGLVLPSDAPGQPHSSRYTAKAVERCLSGSPVQSESR